MSPRPPSKLRARILLRLAQVPLGWRVGLALGIWAGGAVALGTVSTTSGPPLGPLQAAFSAIKLFALDPPGFPANPASVGGAGLWALILLAPMVTASALADFVREHILSSRVLAQGLRDHVVVCGMGAHGRIVVEVCHRRGVPVVVLDPTPGSAPDRLSAGTAVVLHLQGDMTDPVALGAAGVDRAARVFFAAGDPLINIEGARRVRQMLGEGPHAPRLHALVDDADLLASVVAPMGLHRRDLVDQFFRAAEQLVGDPAVQRALTEMADPDCPVPRRVAIVGFGRFGQAILQRLLSSPGPLGACERASVTVELVNRGYRGRVPGAHKLLARAGWHLELSELQDAEAWIDSLREAAPDQQPGLVFLCMDNDALSLRCGALLRSQPARRALVLRLGRPMPDDPDLVTCSVPELFGAQVRGLLDGANADREASPPPLPQPAESAASPPARGSAR